MNNESLRILVGAMEVSPDELIDTDRDFIENDAGMPAETQEFVQEHMANIRAILADDSLAVGVSLGYVISTAVMIVAKCSGCAISDVHGGMLRRAVAIEQKLVMQQFLNSLFQGDEDDA